MQAPNAATDPTSLRLARLEELVATQEAALVQERAKVARLQNENEKLRDAHARLRQELELLQRRIFVAKAERIDTAQLELEFANKLADLNALKATLPEGQESLFDGQHGASLSPPSDGADGKNGNGKSNGSG